MIAVAHCTSCSINFLAQQETHSLLSSVQIAGRIWSNSTFEQIGIQRRMGVKRGITASVDLLSMGRRFLHRSSLDIRRPNHIIRRAIAILALARPINHIALPAQHHVLNIDFRSLEPLARTEEPPDHNKKHGPKEHYHGPIHVFGTVESYVSIMIGKMGERWRMQGQLTSSSNLAHSGNSELESSTQQMLMRLHQWEC